jgi:hypothetical protein
MPTQPTPAPVEVEQNPLVLEAELVAAERFATQGDDEAAELARSVLAVPTTEQTWPIQSRAAANLGPDEQLLWLAQPAYTASAPATRPLQEHAEPPITVVIIDIRRSSPKACGRGARVRVLRSI